LQTAESPFNADRFDIDKVAGGLTGSPGAYTGASALFGFYALSKQEMYLEKDGSTMDPVNEEWEKQALCKMGIDADLKEDADGDGDKENDCPGHPLLKFKAMFARSLSDEFGTAIRGDLVALIGAYYLMAGYLFVMLSRFDTVHSMIAMSCAALAICGMSFQSCLGAGAMIGIYNNNLNTNIPFLLLGLGIDDAFVLTSEFRRATTMLGASASLEDRTAEAMKGGAISILITSATDALAFLVGSSTVVPALRWFCLFAGFGIIFCFIFQVTCYVPCLVLDAKRAEGGYLDFFCCMKAGEPNPRALNEPKGCCGACCKTRKPDQLSDFLRETWGPMITTPIGMGVTGGVFFLILVLSILGCMWIPVNFKLEWFIPDDSYVNEFYQMNDQYFDQSLGINVYTRDIDYYAQQQGMIDLNEYLQGDNASPYIDQSEAVTDWYQTFLEYCKTTEDNTSDPAHTWGGHFTSDTGLFSQEAMFYSALSSFFRSNDGTRYRSSMQWADSQCQERETWDACDWEAGLQATRVDASILCKSICQAEWGDCVADQPTYLACADLKVGGRDRYDTMTALREEISAKIPTSDPEQKLPNVFPFSREFSNWEEVGIIGTEMVSNLIICGTVILVVVFAMIPKPQIAVWVVLCIILSIIDVVGMLYWWDVTINSISTIYVLISIGLAVDYAAHIAHMFKESKGTAQERACAALGRIGPCVLNAIISTALAVCMFGFSKSYIFRTMFKAFCLVVVIAGAHGLTLLPVLLTLFGGDNGVASADTVQNPAAKEDEDEDDDAEE